jgi:hypothetical protein
LIIKSTYKSHFFLKKNFLKNNKKQIFTKSIIVFILFSKIFFKNYNLNIFYNNKKTNKINILKAPSRHKKFFHQVYMEYFCVNFIWSINYNYDKIFIPNYIHIFKKINLIFLKIGTNTLSRVKFKLIFKNQKLENLIC